MKNQLKLALVATLSLAAGQAMALNATGTAWGGKGCTSRDDASTATFKYCTTRIGASTTATQLGKITIDPSKMVYLVGGNSGTVSGVVTPTVTLYLGNQAIATQSVSLTTAGNLVTFGTSPYFDGLSVSVSVPSLLGTSQSAIINIIENSK